MRGFSPEAGDVPRSRTSRHGRRDGGWVRGGGEEERISVVSLDKGIFRGCGTGRSVGRTCNFAEIEEGILAGWALLAVPVTKLLLR